MSYWTYQENKKVVYPVPGSQTEDGQRVINQDMKAKVDYLNILAYAFLHVNKKGVVHFNDSYIDLSSNDNAFCQNHKEICYDINNHYRPKMGNFTAFSKLQNKAGNLNKIISISGGGDKDSFANALKHIPAFVDSIATIIDHYHLKGVDLDFEPDSYTPEQTADYAKLIAGLRKKLGPNALIIVTVAPDQNITRQGWTKIANNASFISDMCYDFHAPFYLPHYTGYSSNLYSDSNEPMMNHYYHISCDQSIKYLSFLGVPNEKILLGYPSNAIAYGGVTKLKHGLFQSFDPNKTPEFDPGIKMRGRTQYQTVLKLLKSGFREYASYNNGHISGVFAYNSNTQQFLSYDNVELIKEKTAYVKKYHLGGLMTWVINDDAPATSKASLLKAVFQSLAK